MRNVESECCIPGRCILYNSVNTLFASAFASAIGTYFMRATCSTLTPRQRGRGQSAHGTATAAGAAARAGGRRGGVRAEQHGVHARVWDLSGSVATFGTLRRLAGTPDIVIHNTITFLQVELFAHAQLIQTNQRPGASALGLASLRSQPETERHRIDGFTHSPLLPTGGPTSFGSQCRNIQLTSSPTLVPVAETVQESTMRCEQRDQSSNSIPPAHAGRIRLLKHEANPLKTEKKPGVPLSSRQVERREMVYTICS